MEGPDKPLNAVATKSADGRTIYFKAVNVGKDAVDVELKIAGRATVHGAGLLLVTPGSEDARNNLGTPHSIWPKEISVKVDQQTISFRMPALSAGVVKSY
jgi:alpha-L-arabinofuranosidase